MCYGNMLSAAFVKARKPHRCWGCYRDIQPGEKYERFVQKDYDGTVRQIDWCGTCHEIIQDWGEVCYEEGCVADWRNDQESSCATCGHWIDNHCDDDGKPAACDQRCKCKAFVGSLASAEEPQR